MAAIPLRADFDAQQLRLIAKKAKDGPQARRLLALAAIYDGALRSEAASIDRAPGRGVASRSSADPS